MRLSINVGYSGSQVSLPMDLIREADRLGFHSAWTANYIGHSDAGGMDRGQTKQLRVGTGAYECLRGPR
jgi:hypothetical protein